MLFRSKSHSRASCGSVVARSLKPAKTALFAQTGHCLPLTLEAIIALYTCPQVLHFHQTFFRLFTLVVSGVNVPFFSDHSAARSGYRVFRSLTPGRSVIPEQEGHSLPPDLVEIKAYHSFPQVWHFHHTRRLAKAVTMSGFKGKFRGDHSFAISGNFEANELVTDTL